MGSKFWSQKVFFFSKEINTFIQKVSIEGNLFVKYTFLSFLDFKERRAWDRGCDENKSVCVHQRTLLYVSLHCSSQRDMQYSRSE